MIHIFFLLRAGVTKARKDLDDISADIADQVDLINAAVGRATPEDALMRYKQALKNFIEEGDIKLTNINLSSSDADEIRSDTDKTYLHGHVLI